MALGSLEFHTGTERQQNALRIKDKGAQLFHNYQSGDREAFTALVEAYHDQAYFLACRFVPPHDAEEIVQEAWLKVSQTDTFNFSQRFGPWFNRITVNRCRDFLRAMKRVKAGAFHVANSTDLDDSEGRNIIDQFQDPHPSETDDRADYEELTVVLGRVDKTYVSVLEMSILGGMKTADIAAAIGRKPATVRWKIAEAKGKLQEEYRKVMMPSR